MSKPKVICMRELWWIVGDEINGDHYQTFPDEDDGGVAHRTHTAPTYLHEWWVSQMEAAEIFYQAGNLHEHTVLRHNCRVVREAVLKYIPYDIATNTITESEGEDE